ncbi:MAG TPA: hypothetical protein VFG32_01645 [Bacteroidota bacterium]|nr:hypothetical protein [Bacteroidota bacterium]
MKFITLVLVSIHLQSYCQGVITTTTANCDDKLYMSLDGKWKTKHDYPGSPGFSKTEQQETFKRLDAVHKLVFEAYPEPKGVDAVWHRTQIANSFFAQKIKYRKEPDGSFTGDDINGNSTGKYSYTASFFHYYCFNDAPKREVRVSGETSTWLSIDVNAALPGLGSKGSDMDNMTIKGYQVYQRYPAKETWKAYEFFHQPGSYNFRGVLICRRGSQPYLPVSRKQYLDYCIPWLDKFYDQMLQGILSEMPVRSKEEQEATKNKWLNKIDQDYKNNPTKKEAARKNYLDSYRTDEQLRDEKKDKVMKLKATTLKLYEKEMEKTTREGLLDSPAIIYDWHPVTADIPIFMTEAEGGGMLVTANPSYWRKDLPKYAPQIIWMHWTWNSGAVGENFRKRIEEYFPIEKLQAMIDK